MSTNEETISVMYEHCRKAYSILREEAEKLGDEVIWEGFMTHLIGDQMGMSTPYYSSILSNLKRMGCVKQIRRGGSSTPSQWALLQPPTVELFQNAESRTVGKGRIDSLEQRVSDITSRLDAIERMLRNGITVTVEGQN